MPPASQLTPGELAAVTIGLALASSSLAADVITHCGARLRLIEDPCPECQGKLARAADMDDLAVRFSDMVVAAVAGKARASA